jgi:hypothetical protein
MQLRILASISGLMRGSLVKVLGWFELQYEDNFKHNNIVGGFARNVGHVLGNNSENGVRRKQCIELVIGTE